MGEPFIDNFLLPFWHVVDRPIVVGDVKGAAFAQTLLQTGVGTEDEALYERCFYKCNAIASCDVPWPHADALVLSVVAHDLLVIGDPDRSARQRRKEAAAVFETLAILPALTRFDQVLVRAAAVRQFDQCVRRDTTVKFWAGKRVFFGRDVPKRIVALPGLRLVRTQQNTLSVCSHWPDAHLSLLQAFWCQSPLSWLCNAHRWSETDPRPEAHLLAAILREPALRAFVAQAQVDRDLDWLDWLQRQAIPPLEKGLRQLAHELDAYGAAHPALNLALARATSKETSTTP